MLVDKSLGITWPGTATWKATASTHLGSSKSRGAEQDLTVWFALNEMAAFEGAGGNATGCKRNTHTMKLPVSSSQAKKHPIVYVARMFRPFNLSGWM